MKMATPPTTRTSAAPSLRAKPPQRLRVVVADDHHHVLPEIHLAIRRRVLPFHGIHIVHFDAHPDLSFSSSISAAQIFEPEQLYESLDNSPSGIAEFLLPLVYAGHVDRITWIKPPWATQMATGSSMSDIAIGRPIPTERVSVSCPWMHFIEDDLYAPASAMDPTTIKLWTLDVLELPPTPVPSSSSSASTAVQNTSEAPYPLSFPSTPWILDIDLDYFSTWNPFRKQLEDQTDLDPASLDLLTRVFTRVGYRTTPTDMLTTNQRIHERNTFHSAMAQLQEQQLYQDVASPATHSVLETLSTLYKHEEEEEDTMAVLARFCSLLQRVDDSTRVLIWHAAPCLDLPHHESSPMEIEALLTRFQSFLVHCVSAAGCHPPALVTIATSVSDLFLPPHQLDHVRGRVLAIVEEILGPIEIEYIEYE